MPATSELIAGEGPALEPEPVAQALDVESTRPGHGSAARARASEAAGTLQVQRALAEGARVSLRTLLRNYVAAHASQAAASSKADGNGAVLARARAEGALFSWVLETNLATLHREMAELAGDELEPLFEALELTAQHERARELSARVFLATDATTRNSRLGAKWLVPCSFDWITSNEEVALLRTLVLSAPAGISIILNLKLGPELQAKVSAAGPVPDTAAAKVEQLEREDALGVTRVVIYGPDRGEFSLSDARERWVLLPAALRMALLTQAWAKAIERAPAPPHNVNLLLIADPTERAPHLARLVKADLDVALAELAPDTAPVLQAILGEVRAADRIPMENLIIEGNPTLARALGLSYGLRNWRAVDAVTAPEILHDHGFLDDGKGNIDETKRRAPTLADYSSRAVWLLKLFGAKLLRPDLAIALRSYQHFLEASGADLEVDFDRYLAEDPSGRTTIENLLEEARDAAIALSDARGAQAERFATQTQVIQAGPGNERAPYPATETWQKTIGGYNLWAWADVDVKTAGPGQDRHFELDVHVILDDRYNFNPDGLDLHTHTSDSANGIFELTGLGKEFMSRGRVHRKLSFAVPADRNDQPTKGEAKRSFEGPTSAPASDAPPSTG